MHADGVAVHVDQIERIGERATGGIEGMRHRRIAGKRQVRPDIGVVLIHRQHAAGVERHVGQIDARIRSGGALHEQLSPVGVQRAIDGELLKDLSASGRSQIEINIRSHAVVKDDVPGDRAGQRAGAEVAVGSAQPNRPAAADDVAGNNVAGQTH